jgi:hypothetical protein
MSAPRIRQPLRGSRFPGRRANDPLAESARFRPTARWLSEGTRGLMEHSNDMAASGATHTATTPFHRCRSRSVDSTLRAKQTSDAKLPHETRGHCLRRTVARKRGHSQLVVKGRNHVIQTEWTYGRDPERFPS